MKHIAITILFFLAFIACEPAQQLGNVKSAIKESGVSKIDKYWYQGKAEITSYELTQNRYDAEHPGEVVMIFVTEDFLTDYQVKNDHYEKENSTGILKLNKIKNFTAGLYDYSIMTSVFTPTDLREYPHSLKVTNSSQDWCGQTFQQLNLRDGQYVSTLHSYFEREADRTDKAKVVWLEDELFTRLRMNPDDLPTGAFNIIPSLEYLRLKHKPFRSMRASAKIRDYDGIDFDGSDLKSYIVEFNEGNRSLEIIFEKISPYKIKGWIEKSPSVFDSKVRTTKAIAKAEVFTPYWEQNSLGDSTLRDKLLLN